MFNYEPVISQPLPRAEINGQRFYLTPDGKNYPSVTTVCSLLNKDGISEWVERVGAEEANKIRQRAANRGTRIHKLCEDYLQNKTVTPSITDFEMWKNLRPLLNNIGDVFGLEVPLYSNYLKVAGTVDCVATWNGRFSVIDFKTSTKLKLEENIKSYFMQAAAYAVMWEERYKRPINTLVIIIAVDDELPQVFIEKRDTWIHQFIALREEYKKSTGH